MFNLSKKSSIFLAIISGILAALSFPVMLSKTLLPNFGFLAWICFVPLFVAIYHATPRKSFLLTFLTGFVFYSLSLYWIYNALTVYGGLYSYVAIGILFLMMVILAALMGLITLCTSFIKNKFGGSYIYIVPIVWVAVELLRSYFPFRGFPWNNIAYSQALYPIFIQSADMFGIFGLTFVIILVNQLLAEVIVKKIHLTAPKLFAHIAIAVAVFTVLIAYGWYRVQTIEVRSPDGRQIRIGMVQGNIPQDQKWDSEALARNLAIYKKFTNEIKKSRADLIIWPESSFPYVLSVNDNVLDLNRIGLSSFAEGGAWLLFGALASKKTPESSLYNSAFLIDNLGNIKGRYDKVHLVPFGEYVPFKKFLFFAKKIVAPVGNFKFGDIDRKIQTDKYQIGTLICYEDVFPAIARRHTQNGANILINMTNDAWYGWTAAAYQHLYKSIFRAVENRRFVLRATNTGVSAVINPLGRVEIKSKLFVPGVMISDVDLRKGETIYDIIGNMFAYICAGLTILLIASCVVRIRRA